MDFVEMKKLADKGINEMAISVAYEYEYGLGKVKRDVKKAIHYYRKAGDTESKERANNLAKELKN